MKFNFEAIKQIPQIWRESNPKNIEVTDQASINFYRGKIANWRETVGLDIFSFRVVPTLAEKAAENGFHQDATNFWNELSLVLSQVIKKVDTYTRIPGAKIVRELAIQQLEKNVGGSRELIGKYGSEPEMDLVSKRQGRFEGNLLFHKGKYEEAIAWYDTGIDSFMESPNLIDRANILELLQFKIESQIFNHKENQEEIHKDVEAGLQNYDNYSDTKEGKALKANDELRWINWRAGNMAKMVGALIETNSLDYILPYKEKILSYLKESYNSKTKDGKAIFPKRLSELASLWEKLVNLEFTSGSISDPIENPT